MEMCYDGALVMPSSYAVMNEEEMTYVAGGGWYFNNTYRGTDAWYKIAEFVGITIASIFAMKASIVAAAATSITVVGAIAAVTTLMASMCSAIFNSYNAIAGLVYTIKTGGFRHSGYQVAFWPSINIGTVSAR